MNTTLICTKCKQRKVVKLFSVDRSRKTGRQSQCKECIKSGVDKELRKKTVKKYDEAVYKDPVKRAKKQETSKEWAQNNPDRVKELGQRWHNNNRTKRRAYVKKDSFKRRSLIGDAQFDGYAFIQKFQEMDYKCYYCGKVITLKTVTRDHFIPLTKGGTNEISNIVPACVSCNCSKGNKLDWNIGGAMDK
jgi:5-methylcytosine-specific restriction endonuclease McrA